MSPGPEPAPGPPAPEVEVTVLGPVGVRGASRPLRRARTLDLVVYLAMHPRGAGNDAWATALWPDRVMAPPTLHSTVSAARRALGRSGSGSDHLPRGRGRLQLAPTVSTDWRRFLALAGRTDVESWAAALDLVNGRPFEGLNADWAVLEGWVAEIEEAVVNLTLRLTEHRLEAGDGAGAARAARRALRASPFDERLYRVLLRAADAQGHPGGVESVMGELGRLLSPDPAIGRPVRYSPADLVHPETASLYAALSRRSWAATGRVVARL